MSDHIGLEELEPRRLFDAGSLDTSFGNKGISTVFPGEHFFTFAVNDLSTVLPMSDGRVVVPGSITSEFATRRLLAGGDLDPLFPVKKLREAFPLGTCSSSSFALTANDDLLTPVFLTPSQTAIVRITPSGKIDRSFGKHGLAKLPFRTNVDAITVLPDGRLAVSGYTNQGLSPDTGAPVDLPGLVILSANGHIDTTFGDHGLVQFTELDQIDDQFQADEFVSQAQQAFLLPDGRVMYLRSIQDTSTQLDDEDNVTGRFLYSNMDPHLLDANGKDDPSFEFDRTNVLGIDNQNRWFLNGARQTPDGSVQFLYVLNDGTDTTPKYDAFVGTLGEDGTMSSTKLASDIFAPTPIVARDGDGDIFLQTAAMKFTRFHSNGTRVGSFSIDASLSKDTFIGASIANDGEMLALFSHAVSTVGDSTLELAKIQTGNAPVGVFAGGMIKASRGTSDHFRITWHDDDRVDAQSLALRSIIIDAPDGTPHGATLESLTSQSDATTITATYRLAAPPGGWTASSNGAYRVRLRPKTVRDTRHHFAAARVLGQFVVNIRA